MNVDELPAPGPERDSFRVVDSPAEPAGRHVRNAPARLLRKLLARWNA